MTCADTPIQDGSFVGAFSSPSPTLLLHMEERELVQANGLVKIGEVAKERQKEVPSCAALIELSRTFSEVDSCRYFDASEK